MPLTLLPPPRPPGCPAHRLQIQPRLGDSILDMLEPVFALVATEVAWRVADPDRIISAEAVATVVTAGVRHACTYVCARDGNCCRGGCLWWMSARCGRCPHLFPSSPTASHHTHPPPMGVATHPPHHPMPPPSLPAASSWFWLEQVDYNCKASPRATYAEWSRVNVLRRHTGNALASVADYCRPCLDAAERAARAKRRAALRWQYRTIRPGPQYYFTPL